MDLGLWGKTAEEPAHFFVFLCSDMATYPTGSTSFVDGGIVKMVWDCGSALR